MPVNTIIPITTMMTDIPPTVTFMSFVNTVNSMNAMRAVNITGLANIMRGVNITKTGPCADFKSLRARPEGYWAVSSADAPVYYRLLKPLRILHNLQ